MSNTRYTEEFKVEACKQITDLGYSVYDIAQRLGVSTHSLCDWRKKYGQGPQQAASLDDQETEIRRFRSE